MATENLDQYYSISQLVEANTLTADVYNEVFPNVIERIGKMYNKEYKVPRWTALRTPSGII